MTRFYVRFSKDTGRHIAIMSREDHYLEPQPRNDGEDILEISPEMYILVNQKPEAWNYADGEVTPLIWGKLSVSSDFFYPSREDEENFPDLDFYIEIQPQFPDLPVDEMIRITINNREYKMKNFGEPAKLRSPTTGLFSVFVSDKRVLAEPNSFFINCIAVPEVTDGN